MGHSRNVTISPHDTMYLEFPLITIKPSLWKILAETSGVVNKEILDLINITSVHKPFTLHD